MRWVLQLCAMLMIACVTASHAQAQAPARRVALVIGESAYRTVSPLANPGADARLVADALARAGFDVRLGLDLDKAGLETALDDFARDAQVADVAAVYFAGHGFENGGRNWLVPIDAAIAGAADVERAAVPFEAVARSLSGAKVKLVALDACRDNPFAARTAEGGVINRGLAEVELDGYVVLYAAGVGAVALDGGAGNSPFAQAYARRVSETNVDLRLLAGRIRDDVSSSTSGRQRPFVSASLSGEETVLSPAPAGRVRGAASTRERPSAYFEFVRRVADPSCFQTSDVRCLTTWFSVTPAGRIVTQVDDKKLRIFDPTGATLQRTIPVPDGAERLIYVGAIDSIAFSGSFRKAGEPYAHQVEVHSLNGGAPKTGGFNNEYADHILAATQTPPMIVFKQFDKDPCPFLLFDLRTMKQVDVYMHSINGVGECAWAFANPRDSSIIVRYTPVILVQTGRETQADRADRVALINPARVFCQVTIDAADGAFNELGGFHLALRGDVMAYDGRCRLLRTDRLHQAEVRFVSNFDKTSMISRSVDGVMKIWNASTGRVEAELSGLPRGAEPIGFAARARAVLILNEDKHLYIWNGEPRLGAYVGPSAPVCQGMLSEDANTLYARRCDGVLEVWRRRAT